MNISLGNVQKNRLQAVAMIEKAIQDGPDVIVLPELWNTGFFPENVKKLADLKGEPSCSFLSELAAKYRINLVGGSIASKEDDRIYNINYVFDRKGKIISRYKKIHLFSPSGEDNYFKHGNEISVYEIDGIKAATIICYDLRFVELVRILALKGVQILFIVAQWPHPRLEHWQILLKARAIENQLFIAAVNTVGKAKELIFCGNSMLINPWGKVLADAKEEVSILAYEIDFADIHDIRKKMNIFRDRQPTTYKL